MGVHKLLFGIALSYYSRAQLDTISKETHEVVTCFPYLHTYTYTKVYMVVFNCNKFFHPIDFCGTACQHVVLN